MAGIPELPQTLRPRAGWLPRASLGLGIVSTIAMNVAAGSRGGIGGALVGALIPVAFVLALETLIWLVREIARAPWGWLWCTLAGLPLFGLALITGVVSYLHALTVAEWTGSTGVVAHLIPLVPDQLILTGSAALMAVALARRDSGKPRGVVNPEQPKPEQPKPEQAKVAPPKRTRKAKTPPRVVRVRDLVKDLPPARVAELAAMSKRDLAAVLDVTPWAAEVWLRDQKAGERKNGHDLEVVSR